MENQPPIEQKPKKKKKWLWIVGGVILFFIIIVAITPVPENENIDTNTTIENENIVSENTNQETTPSTNGESVSVVENTPSEETNIAPVATNTDTETAPLNTNQEVGSPINEPIVLENTNQEATVSDNKESEKITINRSDIINLFPDFDFNKESPVDGQENYIGRSSNGLSMIQLIGPDESLSEVGITNTMGPDSIDEYDKISSYLRELKNELTPNLNPDFPKIEGTTDNTISDGLNIEYTYLSLREFASGVFSEVYIFTPIE